MTNQGIGDRQYYETHYLTRDWQAYRYLLMVILRLSQPGPILDLGAGLGYFVEAATRWGFPCMGLEGSPDAVAMARERLPEIALQQHPLSEPLPYPGASVQTVLLNQVIEHLEPEIGLKVIAECFRVLKPGGLVVIESPGKYNEYERTADPTHLHLYAPTELSNALATAGFVRISSNNQPLDFLGKNWLAKRLSRRLFKRFPIDRWSATASCVAFKPTVESLT